MVKLRMFGYRKINNKVVCAFFDSEWNIKEQGQYEVKKDIIKLNRNGLVYIYFIIPGKQTKYVVTGDGRVIHFKEPTYVFKDNDPIPVNVLHVIFIEDKGGK